MPGPKPSHKEADSAGVLMPGQIRFFWLGVIIWCSSLLGKALQVFYSPLKYRRMPLDGLKAGEGQGPFEAHRGLRREQMLLQLLSSSLSPGKGRILDRLTHCHANKMP